MKKVKKVKKTTTVENRIPKSFVSELAKLVAQDAEKHIRKALKLASVKNKA